MAIEMNYFCSMFTLALGLALLGSGLFTAYFGAGKSRTIGIGLTILGAIFAFLFVYLPGFVGDATSFDQEFVKDALVATLGAAVGVAIAVGVMLGVLMKVDTTEDLDDLDLDDLEDIDLDEELKKLEAELESEEDEVADDMVEDDVDQEAEVEEAADEDEDDEGVDPVDETPADDEEKEVA